MQPFAVPSSAEVEKEWALTDSSKVTPGERPHIAFQKFLSYAQRALNDDYEKALERSLLEEAALSKEIGRVHGWQPTPTKEVTARVNAQIGARLRERIGPLLPLIQSYMQGRRNDPMAAGRLGWMIEQVENIPGALSGQVCHPYQDTNEFICWSRTIEPGLWKEFWSGLLDIADGLDGTAHPHYSERQTVNVEHMRWLRGADLFGYLFRRLADKGYIAAPTRTYKGKEEVHAGRFAKELLHHWQVGPADADPAKVSTITTALSPSAHIHSDTIDRLLEDLEEEDEKPAKR